jgi:hypothetical protein
LDGKFNSFFSKFVLKEISQKKPKFAKPKKSPIGFGRKGVPEDYDF